MSNGLAMRFAVGVGGECRGFVLVRRHQFEAFNPDQKSLGLFDTEQPAVDAVLKLGTGRALVC
jgi:hypothetical protein